jgi:signal transduction histidine kinase/ligand-binding sensor domain-containing protein/AraC-like DNA-binding protein/CheY-like chemotaxis protein
MRISFSFKKNNTYKNLVFIVSFILVPLFSLSQNYLRYNNYTQSNGLSDNYINSIYQDSRGFIWIGTWNGINRFDGFNFKKYVANKSKPEGIQGDWIFEICEDKQKNLWACTNSGLIKYDWQLDQFEKIKGLDTMALYDFVQDGAGYFWITTETGLLKYDPKQNLIIQRFCQSAKSSNFPANKLTHLVLDNQDNLWIGSFIGLIYFNTKNFQYKVYDVKSKDKSIPDFYFVRSLVFDTNGSIWMIGKYNSGIAIFDTLTKSFSFKRNEPNNIHSIPSNSLNCISRDKKGEIWACCQNECLSRYDRATNSFFRYDRDQFIPTSINAQSPSCIFTDNVGNFWVGSHGNGIFFLNTQKNVFKSYSMMSKKELVLPCNIISSFAEMSDGKIIVGTDGGGFCEFDRTSETFKTYNTNSGLLSNAVTKVLAAKNDIVWIAAWNGGLDKFNYKSKKFEHIKSIPGDKSSLIFNNLKDLYTINDTSMWVVTHGEGITLMNTKTNKFISHASGVKTPFDLSSPQWGNNIMRDKKGRLWVAANSSLNMYDGHKYISFNTSNLNRQKRSSNSVSMTYEDYQGVIWIVTDKEIDYYNEKDNNYKTYTSLEGMPHNPKAIIEDLHHNLWISSSDGLSRIDSKRKSIKHYSIQDGLPSKDFVARAVYRLKDGTLLFGGTFGFIMFHPDSLFINQNKAYVVLDEMLVNHKIQIPGKGNYYLKKALQSTDTIEYLYNHDVISFNFSGVDFSNPDQISYSYKIKGLSDSWIPLGNDRSLTLPSLDPGNYTLFVKATKSDSIYSINGNGLTIIIFPPWWKTIWLKIIVVLLILFAIILFIRIRLKKIEAEKKLLEQLVVERTKFLNTTIESLNEAKIVIELKNSELSESIELKNKLIGIIAHDFKSPLNAITGLVELIQLQTNSIPREKLGHYIQNISESAQKLENNIAMMTDWAHSSFKNITYHPTDINLGSLLKDAIALMRERARQKDISLSIQADVVHNAYVDGRMIHSVFINLLSNALKFTHEHGTIIVTIQEIDSRLEVTFIDTGIGINKEKIDLLFSDTGNAVSTNGTNGEKGFGFGLQICREFVKKNNGTISVKSHPGKGSVFIVNLPVAQTVAELPIEERDKLTNLSAEKTDTENTTKQYSILIIDDDEELVTMLQAVFESNFNVFKAYDGKSGLHIAQNLIPDVIISDIKLPGMSGLEVSDALKKDAITAHIPVIIISGENIPGLESECYSYGAMGFLAKPFSGQMLKNKVFALLETIHLNKQKANQQNKHAIVFNLPESADDIIIHRIIELLNSNIENPDCDIDSLATELGLSRTQFWRKTKSILGKTPSILLRDLRLNKASEMIKSGKYRVSDVAYHVGFSDPRYFTRSFTKQFGISPSEYYEMHKNHNKDKHKA